MKLAILMFRNKALGCYTAPIFDDHDPEVVAKQFARSILSDKSLAAKYKNLDLYYFGDFDDESGNIKITDKVKLLDCDDLFNAAKEKKLGVEDGGSEKVK